MAAITSGGGSKPSSNQSSSRKSSPTRRRVLFTFTFTFTFNCHPGKTHNLRSRGDTTRRAQTTSSQSVSQLFHGPTPRSHLFSLYRLSIRLLFTKYHGPVSQSVISLSHPALTTGSRANSIRLRRSRSNCPVQPSQVKHNIMGTNWRNPIQLLYCTVHGTVLDVAHTDSQTCHHNTLQQSALRNNTASSQALVPCSLLHAPDGRSRPVRTEAGLHNVPHPAALARSRTSDRI